MVAKETSLHQVPVHDNSELQDFDDAAETLSLCDLPLNGYASNWDGFSREDQSLGSSFDQDFFEFFSEDFTASNIYPKDEIIFCGKLITCKGEAVAEKTQILESTKKAKNTKKSFIFPWKSSSFNKSRATSSKQLQEKSDKTLQEPLSENHGFATRKYDDRYDFSMKKVSILATPTKPRWYFLAFGVGKLPMEMELSDIKMRQSKKSPSRMIQSEKVIETSSGNKRGQGSWSLLRVLGCNSQHSSARAKASLGGAPIV
ncbi:hypothetical protein NC653_020231 [Populus alba x Populus x berolinensis]|uniref:Uncharacterized protein n=1 Tax=Populus alba x Populus x berolinensis TaxID=444605 RepID=A0AAD6QDJ8_9ROSI|nr:hypothetical protein NC653_020231 [Populus alba x Populus x berolinensis]